MLIVVRAGRQSLHRSWSHLCYRFVDVAISSYDDSDWSGPDTKFLHRSPGGKFQGIKAFFAENPALVDSYDYFWMLDDDLVVPHASLVTLCQILARFHVPLCSPALSYDSFFSWPITVQNDAMLLRGTDFVEVMAPIMSRDLLKAALPHFDENRSSWGYEWLWRKLLTDRQGFAVIVDAAPIVHTRPLGQASLRQGDASGHPTPNDELVALTEKFALDRDEPFRMLFGITAEAKPRLLIADDLMHAMLSGYRRVAAYDFGSFTTCIDALLRMMRPIAPVEALRELTGFAAVEAAVSGRNDLLRDVIMRLYPT